MIHRMLAATLVGMVFLSNGCDSTTDQERMQGKWLVVSHTTDGKEMPDEVKSKIRLVIEGDAMYVTPMVVQSGDGYRVTDEPVNGDGTKFVLRTWTNPKEIDVQFDGQALVQGIYKLDGDSLEYCASHFRSAIRPQEFTSPPGSSRTLIVLKRERKGRD